MSTETMAYTAALYVVALAVGVQLGALWGARIERTDAAKRENRAYDEGYNDGSTRRPRRWTQ